MLMRDIQVCIVKFLDYAMKFLDYAMSFLSFGNSFMLRPLTVETVKGVRKLKQCAANKLFYSIGYTVKYWGVLPTTRGGELQEAPFLTVRREGEKKQPTVRKEKF